MWDRMYVLKFSSFLAHCTKASAHIHIYSFHKCIRRSVKVFTVFFTSFWQFLLYFLPVVQPFSAACSIRTPIKLKMPPSTKPRTRTDNQAVAFLSTQWEIITFLWFLIFSLKRRCFAHFTTTTQVVEKKKDEWKSCI